jgi:hypothetical protein
MKRAALRSDNIRALRREEKDITMKRTGRSHFASRSITAVAFVGIAVSSVYGQPATKNVFAAPGLTTPIGIAYSSTANALLITEPFCGTPSGANATGFSVQAVSPSGGNTLFANLPAVPLSTNPAFGHNTPPGNACFEFYPAVSPGLGGFTAGDVYVSLGNSVAKIPAAGGSASIFATGLNATDTESGITFDSVGTFCNDLIVVGQNGGINLITSGGSVVNYATLPGGVQLESASVAPLSFGAHGGWLIIGNHAGNVLAVPPPASCPATTPASPVSAVNISNQPGGPEGLVSVPPQAGSCNFGQRNGGSLFSVTYTGPVVIPNLNNPYQIVAYPASNFSSLIGDVIVSDEFGATSTISPGGSSTVFDAGTAPPAFVQQEGLTFVNCPAPPPGTGCPATQGFWHKGSNWPAVTVNVDGIQYNGGTDFSMVIGGITYSQAELLQLMPSGSLHSGNYANSLSQLIAAVLNIAAGAQHSASVDAVVTQDNTALNAVPIFCGGGATLCSVPAAVASVVQGNLNALDDYNSALGLNCVEGSGLNTGKGK